jgi:hypothetical protein
MSRTRVCRKHSPGSITTSPRQTMKYVLRAVRNHLHLCATMQTHSTSSQCEKCNLHQVLKSFKSHEGRQLMQLLTQNTHNSIWNPSSHTTNTQNSIWNPSSNTINTLDSWTKCYNEYNQYQTKTVLLLQNNVANLYLLTQVNQMTHKQLLLYNTNIIYKLPTWSHCFHVAATPRRTYPGPPAIICA